jgi:hypothetical protein
MSSVGPQQRDDQITAHPHGGAAGAFRYVERSQAQRALRDMTDAELAEWTALCRARGDRAGLANGAARAWKSLLADARSERRRRTSPVSGAGSDPR